MTTRLQLRTIIRERLEDTTATPLWSDAALNEFLAEAVRAYGVRFPRQATAATDPILESAVSTPLPVGVPETGIVAVRDARGRDLPPTSTATGPSPLDASVLIQAWRVWAGTLHLQRPPRGDEAGIWTIDYLAGRELVADDVTPQPIDPGDEPIVVALAAAMALERRAVEDAKRGARTSLAAPPAAGFRREADHLIAARKRRARSGSLTLMG